MDCPPSKIYQVRSSDNETFGISERAIEESVTLRNLIFSTASTHSNENRDTTIPIPKVSGNILKLVIEWCEIEKNEAEESEFPNSEWKTKMLNLNHQELTDVVFAANYLDIAPLLDYSCGVVAGLGKKQGPSELSNIFKVETSDTGKEHAKFLIPLTELPWVIMHNIIKQFDATALFFLHLLSPTMPILLTKLVDAPTTCNWCWLETSVVVTISRGEDELQLEVLLQQPEQKTGSNASKVTDKTRIRIGSFIFHVYRKEMAQKDTWIFESVDDTVSRYDSLKQLTDILFDTFHPEVHNAIALRFNKRNFLFMKKYTKDFKDLTVANRIPMYETELKFLFDKINVENISLGFVFNVERYHGVFRQKTFRAYGAWITLENILTMKCSEFDIHTCLLPLDTIDEIFAAWRTDRVSHFKRLSIEFYEPFEACDILPGIAFEPEFVDDDGDDLHLQRADGKKLDITVTGKTVVLDFL